MLLLFVGCRTVFAEDAPKISESEEWIYFQNSLPGNLAERIAGDSEEMELLEKVQETWSLSSVLDALFDQLQNVLPSALRLLRTVLGIILLSAVFHALGDGVAASPLIPVLDMVFVLAVGSALLTEVSGLIETGGAYIAGLTRLVNGVTPIAAVLCVAKGQIQQSMVIRTALMLLYTLFQNVNAVLLVPPVRLLFGLGIAGSLGGPIHLEAVARQIRQWLGWGMGFFTMLLSLIFGMQTVMARSADSASMRAVQYAVGNFIPMVGGTLSGALSTALESIRTIRSVCGSICAAAVLFLILPVVLELLVHRAVLGICRMTAELFGCEREGHLLGEIYGMLGYLLALTAITSFLFLFVLALLICVDGGGGL